MLTVARSKAQRERLSIEVVESNLLTVAEVAKLLRTSIGSVYWHAEQGKLPGAIKLGRRLLFDGDVLATHIPTTRTRASLGSGAIVGLGVARFGRAQRSCHATPGRLKPRFHGHFGRAAATRMPEAPMRPHTPSSAVAWTQAVRYQGEIAAVR